MQVVALGGTEIGASSLFIEVHGRGFVVDAGVRYEERDPLPSYALLETLGAKVEAIFVTHAHQDHTGSLPVLSRLYPAAPIFMTQPTLAITRVMLADALKLAQQGVGPRLFGEQDLENMLGRVRVMGQDRAIGFEDIRVSTFSAGHILGAVAFGFETPEGSLLVTGDFSVRSGRLLPGGMRFPRGCHFDTVVTEATYGDRLHPNRAEQERGLVERVSTVVAGGGFVLIPAFAVGRAQEVLVILQEAIRHNPEVPRFPLVVDGLVRSINPIYASYPHLLNGPMRRLLHQKGHVFDPDVVRAIHSAGERRQVLQGKPACIVASSGMLNGGPSVFYAAEMAKNSANAILLCGYQDEESPGRALLHLADAPTDQRQWILGDRVLTLDCQLGFYSMSAHADRQEIVTALSALAPQRVVVVHGDAKARRTLAKEWETMGISASVPEVGEPVICQALATQSRPYLPETEEPVDRSTWNGKVLLVARADAAPTLVLVIGQQGAAVKVQDAQGIVFAVSSAEVLLTVGPLPPGQERLAYLAQLGAAARAAYERGMLYGRQPVQRIASALAEHHGDLMPAELQVAELLEPYGYRRLKADPATRRATALCRFPWAIPEQVLGRLQAMAAARDWTFSVAPEIYMPALVELIREVVGDMVKTGSPRVYPEERRIIVPVTSDGSSESDRSAWAALISQRTGGRALFEKIAVQSTKARVSRERWEQNAAARRLRETARPEWAIERYAIYPDEGKMVLYATFPDVLNQSPGFVEWVEEASREIGWEIALAPRVNQGALAKLGQQMVPCLAQPSLYLNQREVGVALPGYFSEEEFRSAAEGFQTQTGWKLVREDQRAPAWPRTSPPPLLQPGVGSPWEVNQAMNHIRQIAESAGLPLTKVSLQGETLVIRCITPEAAELHQSLLQDLAKEVGWPIAVSPAVHQQRLAVLAETIAEPHSVLSPPSIHLAEREVRIRTTIPLRADQEEAFNAATGWRLVPD